MYGTSVMSALALSDLGYGSKLPSPDDLPPGVIKVPPHHPGGPPLGSLADYPPAPWLYRPFTVLPGYLPLPSPLLINRFAGRPGICCRCRS